MKENIAIVAFVVISFLTGLSIAFNLCSILGEEEFFFNTTKNAIVLYLISIFFAISFTILSYYGVCMVQKYTQRDSKIFFSIIENLVLGISGGIFLSIIVSIVFYELSEYRNEAKNMIYPLYGIVTAGLLKK